MTKIAFCGAAGNGISPLEQIMIKKGYEVYAKFEDCPPGTIDYFLKKKF